MKTALRARQSGFTLVEIAIVLVIIGLLLGGVLKGQELINSSRVKSGISDMNGVIAAYNGYVDRYRRQPGDDNNGGQPLANRGAQWAAAVAGNGTGAIDVAANLTFTGGGEGDNFWQHLRAAGLITGNPADVGANAPPTNAFGGRIGIVNAVTQGRLAARLQVCLGSVPGASAAAIDAQIDDGLPGGGSLRATVGPNNTAPAGAAATYNDDQTYTICRDMT